MPYYPPSPNSYPPTGFAQGVGAFLSSYGEVKGIKQRQQDATDRQTAAANADRDAQMREQEQGFTRLTMPTIGAPPDQSFEGKVGSFLSDHFGGGSPQPSTVLMKTGPSARDTEIAGNQAFELGRDATQNAHADLLEGIRAKQTRDLQTEREAAADRRAANVQTGDTLRTGMTQAGEDRRAQARTTAASGLLHAGAAVNNQILQTNREIAAANRTQTAGLSRRASPADSAAYNSAVGGLPDLAAKRDSLQGVYGQIAARMQGVATSGVDPGGEAPATGVEAEHQAIDANLRAAITAGANPAQAAARADQLHASVIARHKKGQ